MLSIELVFFSKFHELFKFQFSGGRDPSRKFISPSPWAKRFRGVIRPESSPHVFLLPKTLNLKKKSGGHLSVVVFGSERPLSENIYTF